MLAQLLAPGRCDQTFIMAQLPACPPGACSPDGPTAPCPVGRFAPAGAAACRPCPGGDNSGRNTSAGGAGPCDCARVSGPE